MFMSNCYVTSTVKSYPKWPYQEIKDAILGRTYVLSLTFIGTNRAISYNKKHRQKNYAPNVLSFPLDQKNGEILICQAVAKKQASSYNLSISGYIAYLFIHGCVHLKGYDHSDKMDKLEQTYLKRFAIS
jgi:probable rRNA maturation factor